MSTGRNYKTSDYKLFYDFNCQIIIKLMCFFHTTISKGKSWLNGTVKWYDVSSSYNTLVCQAHDFEIRLCNIFGQIRFAVNPPVAWYTHIANALHTCPQSKFLWLNTQFDTNCHPTLVLERLFAEEVNFVGEQNTWSYFRAKFMLFGLI